MQPLPIPDVPAALALGSFVAFIGAVALSALCLMLPALSSEGKRRLLVALSLVLLVASVSVYAAQPVTQYCATCASSVEPGSWLWFLICFGC